MVSCGDLQDDRQKLELDLVEYSQRKGVKVRHSAWQGC